MERRRKPTSTPTCSTPAAPDRRRRSGTTTRSAKEPVEILALGKPNAAPKVQLASTAAARSVQPRSPSGAKPRLKSILLQNGAGVTATEYPRSSGGDVVGPTVFGHAGAQARSRSARSRSTTARRPRLLLARAGDPLLRAGRAATRRRRRWAAADDLAKPDIAATDCGATTFFVAERQPGAGPLLRDLGRGAARGRRWPRWRRQADPAPRRPRSRAGLAGTARRRSAPSGPTRSAPAWSTPTGRSTSRPAAESHDHRAPPP